MYYHRSIARYAGMRLLVKSLLVLLLVSTHRFLYHGGGPKFLWFVLQPCGRSCIQQHSHGRRIQPQTWSGQHVCVHVYWLWYQKVMRVLIVRHSTSSSLATTKSINCFQGTHISVSACLHLNLHSSGKGNWNTLHFVNIS